MIEQWNELKETIIEMRDSDGKGTQQNVCKFLVRLMNILEKRMDAEQPEIIRCKDCKYMTEHYDTDGNAPYWTCSEWDFGTDYDGFCHYAERREDG